MFYRKELKLKGKSAFYRNWKMCIITCFIFTLCIGGTLISFSNSTEVNYPDNLNQINIKLKGENNSDIVNDFLNGIKGKEDNIPEFENATEGVLSNVVNNVSKSGSYLFGLLNAINQMIFKDHIWASVIIIIGALCSLFYWIFVSKVLEVGNARFYLENRKYTKTKTNKLLVIYKLNKTCHVAYTMFLKNLYSLLWCFTIIGGFIKYYSYMLVPYILAENPNMKPSDVIKLSRDMMHGYKWEMFKLDISFIGWRALGLITFNIGNIVFTDPYMNATKVEAYMYLRELSKTKGIKNANMLCDTNLDGGIVLGEYPLYEYMLSETKENKWLSFDFNRNYSLWDYILIFFILSGVGWIWEVLLHLCQYGNFVNRGTLYGPWLPIYGAGCVALLVILKKYRKNPFIYFVLAMIVCGLIEYGTSVYLELVHHMAWWDYTGFFLNLNGRVCLEGLLVFGIGGTFVTYIAAPFIANILDKIKKEHKTMICLILVCLIACDFYVSGKKPNTGDGVTTEIKDSKIDKIKEQIKK